MTNRLLVNPGTPQAWEIPLKAGSNRIGRGEDNDFQVSHASVSTHHCEIVVSTAGVLLKDLGSTNGTFVNRAPVREALLQSGQQVQLGGVNMVFEAAQVPAADAPIVIPAAAPARPPVAVRIAAPAQAMAGEPVVDPPLPPPVTPHPPTAGNIRDVGAAYCKFHPKTLARHLCESCQKCYCDMCVITRTVGTVPGKYCRTCGGPCVTIRPHLPQAAKPAGFFARLPGAFVYPFRGSGFLLLIVGTVLFVVLKGGGVLMSIGGLRPIMFGLILQITVGGYLFAYMQTVVHTTAVEDNEMPELLGVSNFWDDVLLPFCQLIGMALVCFSPGILLLIAAAGAQQPALATAAIPVFILGTLYFPMAFLAVVILDTVKAVNPLIIIPSIFRVPLEYFVTLAVLAGVFGIRALGDFVMVKVFSEGLSTKSMTELFLMIILWALWSFAGFYLFVVNIRILGLLYVTKKDKLAWLSR